MNKKVYIADLSSMGVEKKTFYVNGVTWDIANGDRVNEGPLVEVYPQFFVENGETVEVVDVVNVVEETIEDVVENVVENVVEETIEDVVEDVVEDNSVSTKISPLSDFKTKADLEEYALSLGINLNKAKSMKLMYKDLVDSVKK
jgi:hypothetical protein